MFRTGVEGWEYSTHGGTAFIVNFRGKPFGLTCRHVLRDFYWGQLAITAAKFGRKGSQFAALKSLVYPSDPRREAVDTDILDVAVVEFGEKVRAKAVTAGGESGNPSSPHFNDQAKRYSTGDLRDVYFYRSDLKNHIEREYHPGK